MQSSADECLQANENDTDLQELQSGDRKCSTDKYLDADNLLPVYN